MVLGISGLRTADLLNPVLGGIGLPGIPREGIGGGEVKQLASTPAGTETSNQWIPWVIGGVAVAALLGVFGGKGGSSRRARFSNFARRSFKRFRRPAQRCFKFKFRRR